MDLDIITAPDLQPLRHGFFGRAGGASTGMFASLNCGPGSSDHADAIRTNRQRVSDWFGVGETRLATVHQTHSSDVIVVNGPVPVPRPKCDAMVCATPGHLLGILTADCQPVLFGDARAGVIGAAHAGWKGALGGVLEATVAAMVDLGAERTDIAAVIGPCIGPDAYEVGPEFRDRFCDVDAGSAAYFAAGTGDRLLFDLPGYGMGRLRATGIGCAVWTGHCTFSEPGRFFSYRRSSRAGDKDYGRLIAAITL